LILAVELTMTSSGWARLTAVVLLAAAPVIGIEACGSNDSNGSGDDGGAGDDATTDGLGGDGTGHGDAVGDGGSGEGHKGDSCPAPSCPPGATCGHYTDPCSGTTIVCGTQCPPGEVCVGTGGGATSCQKPSCTGKCGVIGIDSCGIGIYCGGCPSGETCVNNQCLTVTVSDAGPADTGAPACGALTCTPNSFTTLCGTIGDSCGDTMQCPACPSGQQCIGGVCTQPPPECTTDAGQHCGNVINACGNASVPCGSCTGANTTCQSGICVGCTPPTCGSTTCGTVSNGCGAPVSCGTCSGGGEKCYDGGCCAPLTCAQAAEAGAFQGCAEVDLGCGVHQSCSACGTGEKCYDGGCCTPLTCGQAVEAGIVTNCGPVDLGCGVAQSCSTCGTGETCYDAGCCTPLTCAQAQDAGLVTGCGKVPLGCGVAQSCAPCAAGQTCEGNVCINCQAKTCADFGNTGCGHNDGCTSTPLDCCPAGTTCNGTICCPPGQVNANGICCPAGEINAGGICCPKGDVNYQGSCCQPKCDTSQPPGPQNSCGITIYCNGTQ
jgi:hypothetical protein